MSLEWSRQHAPRWDAGKANIIGGAPEGIFDARYAALNEGAPLSGEWWAVEREGEVLGYGWLDVVWGDAEILLAVGADVQEQGVGAFILDRLAGEAAARGLNYIYNVVRPTHPEASTLTRWLQKRGFTLNPDGRLTRRAEAPAPKKPSGRIGWLDLTVDDADGVRDFYAAVAGWTVHPVPMDGYSDYAMIPAGSQEPAGGICHRRGSNSTMPKGWIVYIAVDDIEGAMARVEAGGGEILERPREGRPMALVRDPAGNAFALWSDG